MKIFSKNWPQRHATFAQILFGKQTCQSAAPAVSKKTKMLTVDTRLFTNYKTPPSITKKNTHKKKAQKTKKYIKHKNKKSTKNKKIYKTQKKHTHKKQKKYIKHKKTHTHKKSTKNKKIYKTQKKT